MEPRGVLGIQGHPEYEGYPEYSYLCINAIEEFLVNSKHTEFENGFLRVKKENK